jgi:glutamate-ammonia-ligase adenylyltransferase
LSEGGLVDIEFCAQYLQLIHAAAGGPLRANTGEALRALEAAAIATGAQMESLTRAWALQQNLTQLLKIALDDGANPAEEPRALRRLLAKAGAARSFSALQARLAGDRRAAREVFDAIFRAPGKT